MTTPKQSANPAPAKIEPKHLAPAKPKLAAKQGSASKAKPSPVLQSKPGQPKKDQSKQDRVVAMLRRSEGTTVATVMKATGWQKHSVHGFFAGVVRKKLRLNLVSEMTGDKRVYRIVDGKRTNAGPSSRKRAA